MEVRIRTGDTEPIQVFTVDDSAAPLTGLTDLFVKIRRNSDGQYLDWFDQTFKVVGWTTLNQVLSEVDATNSPGVYEVTGGLDTSALTNSSPDDVYIVVPLQTPGTNARLPGPGEIKVGQWVDEITTMQQSQTAQTSVVTGGTALAVETNVTQADDFYNGMILVVQNAAGTAARQIDVYQQINGTFILLSALPFTPSPNDPITVLSTAHAEERGRIS